MEQQEQGWTSKLRVGGQAEHDFRNLLNELVWAAAMEGKERIEECVEECVVMWKLGSRSKAEHHE